MLGTALAKVRYLFIKSNAVGTGSVDAGAGVVGDAGGVGVGVSGGGGSCGGGRGDCVWCLWWC